MTEAGEEEVTDGGTMSFGKSINRAKGDFRVHFDMYLTSLIDSSSTYDQ